MTFCKGVVALHFLFIFAWITSIGADRLLASEQFNKSCRGSELPGPGFCVKNEDIGFSCTGHAASIQKSYNCPLEEWCCYTDEEPLTDQKSSVGFEDSVDAAPCGHGNGADRSAVTGDLSSNLGIRRFARIFKGTIVEQGDTCWVAALFDRGDPSQNIPSSFLCAVTIINSTHVITAAHCIEFYFTAPQKLEIHTGITDASPKSAVGSKICMQKLRVRDIIISPKYDPESLSLDMALLKVEEVIKTNDCTCRVCLLDRIVTDTSSLTTCWVAGFGTTREGGMSPLQLTKSNVDFIRKDRCEVLIGEELSGSKRFTLPSSAICAGDLQQGGLCPKDGGAPLTCIVDGRHTLVGIGSWSLDCSRLPSVFSSLLSCQNFLSHPDSACEEHKNLNKAAFALSNLQMGGGPTCGIPGTSEIDPLRLAKQDPDHQTQEANRIKSEIGSMRFNDKLLVTSFQTLGPNQIKFIDVDAPVKNKFVIDGVAPTTTSTPPPVAPIVGGKAVPLNEICWQVLISTGCGGSIISDNFILTAAHCVTIAGTTKPRDHRGIKVVLGATQSPLQFPMNSCQKLLGVRRIIVNPGYFLGNATDAYVSADIALLELDTAIDFSKPCVCRICLQNTQPAPGELCAATGFGCQKPTTPGQPCADQSIRSLMKLKVAMPGDDVCSAFFHNFPKPILTCSASNSSQGPCFGDSGGPLVCYNNERNTYYQAGITSFAIFPDGSEKCAGGNLNFQYYTKVVGFLSWIRQEVPDVMVVEASSFSFQASFKIDLGNGMSSIISNHEVLPNT